MGQFDWMFKTQRPMHKRCRGCYVEFVGLSKAWYCPECKAKKALRKREKGESLTALQRYYKKREAAKSDPELMEKMRAYWRKAAKKKYDAQKAAKSK